MVGSQSNKALSGKTDVVVVHRFARTTPSIDLCNEIMKAEGAS
jgi:hypothetical protein